MHLQRKSDSGSHGLDTSCKVTIHPSNQYITSYLGHYSFTHIQLGLIRSNSMPGSLSRSLDITHGIGHEDLSLPTLNSRGLIALTMKV